MLSSNRPDLERYGFLAQGLRDVGYHLADPLAGGSGTWRISPRPLALGSCDVEWLYALGRHLRAFNRAADQLYLDSAAGRQPMWIARYLDQGKPEGLVSYSRTRQVRRSCPTVIRPDVIPTPQGMLITELDAVPGGMGVIAKSAELYNALGYKLVGDDVTLPCAFADMVRSVSGDPSPRLAIVVSDESAAYRAEMVWLAARLADHGIEACAVAPEELRVSDDGVAVTGRFGGFNVGVVYRFFELFDLSNVPNAQELMVLNARNRVCVIPPFRPLFEEKMWAALLGHPTLAPYWQSALTAQGYAFLRACTPATWVLDPTPVPPHATIPGLTIGGSAVNSWECLKDLGRKQRHFVIKPSGFSERAWGSRGVVVGHDISTPEWNAALAQAIGSFAESPHILQEFRAGRHFEGEFFDTDANEVRAIPCRVRLCPYFLVIGEEIKLTSVMATMCPLDKKKIHGMPDAIIVPCCVQQ